MTALPLPFFVYGTLKPDQLGFRQIDDLVEQCTPARLKGYTLWARDGLPGLFPNPNGSVDGVILHPRAACEDLLENVIRAFEPSWLYDEVSFHEEQELRAEPLDGSPPVAIRTHMFTGDGPTPGRPAKGNPVPWEADGWRVADDPLFAFGLPVMRATVLRLATTPGDSAPPTSADFWMDYTLMIGQLLAICGVLERYLTLSQGPTEDDQGNAGHMTHETGRPPHNDGLGQTPRTRQRPGSISGQLRSLGKSESGLEAIRQAQVPEPQRKRVYNSKSGKSEEWKPRNAWNYWYQVRSNAVHRSKDGTAPSSVDSRVAISQAASAGCLQRFQTCSRAGSSPSRGLSGWSRPGSLHGRPLRTSKQAQHGHPRRTTRRTAVPRVMWPDQPARIRAPCLPHPQCRVSVRPAGYRRSGKTGADDAGHRTATHTPDHPGPRPLAGVRAGM